MSEGTTKILPPFSRIILQKLTCSHTSSPFIVFPSYIEALNMNALGTIANPPNADSTSIGLDSEGIFIIRILTAALKVELASREYLL